MIALSFRQHYDILDITYYHNKKSAIFFKIRIEERIRIKTRESRLPDALFNCCSTDVVMGRHQ
jgi:hypothetical protein